jgi:hypothetical protein
MDDNGVAAHNDCPSSRSCGEIMSGKQRHCLLPLVVTTSLGLMALGVSTAQAHTHPTPIERAAPAVVYIEGRANVEVALIEHHTGPEKRAVHISIIQSTWNPLLDTASGFFVDPNGTVVTTGDLLRPRNTDAEVYAVNEAFAKQYGVQAPLPPNPYSRHHVGKGTNTVDQRLQACYPPHKLPNDSGGCVIRTTMAYTVHPYVTDQRLYGNLPAEVDTKHSTPQVALLRVRSNNLPTVTVAPPSAQETALAVLGFTDIPGATGDHKQLVINQHFATPGGPVLKSAHLDAAEAAGSAMLKKELGRGVEGGPVVAGGGKATSSGQVVGLIPAAAPAGQPVPTLVGATTILGVLKSAGVPNQTSLTDAQFEAAMHHFKNKEYAASIPFLENTLKQFRGHALAAADLAIAKEQVAKGAGAPTMTTPATAATTSTSQSSSGKGLLVLGLVVAAVAALVILGVALRQRRRGTRADGKAAPPPAGSGPTAAASGGPAKAVPLPGRGAPTPARGSTAAPAAGAPSTPAGGAPSRVRERPELLRQTPVTGAAPGAQPSMNRPPSPRAATDQPSALQHSPNSNPSPVNQLTAGGSTAGSTPAPPVTKFCTSCGGRLAAGHRFCGRCGAPVGN